MNTRQNITRTEWAVRMDTVYGQRTEWRATEEAARAFVPPAGATVTAIEKAERLLDY